MSELDTNQITQHYKRFNVTERTLLTGHSHQAWPDVAFEGQQQAFIDASRLVDDKWNLAFEKADKLKTFYANLLGEQTASNYALASNTHDLLVRFLSALDWKKTRRIVTTDGEFHSMRRQLSRLQEEGVEVIRVAVSPAETLTERMLKEVTENTSAVMMSAVMFKDARIIPHLQIISDHCAAFDIPILIDAYHALNVVPFTIKDNGINNAFIVGGGYKYCQFGEGNCFLRIPDNCQLRPIVTGWYAEFGTLEKTNQPGATQYPKGGDRFQGSTYDPTSHYRAGSVIDFFKQQNFTDELLRIKSQYQVRLLRDAFDQLDCNPQLISRADVPLENIAGFLSFKTEAAALIQNKLAERSILTDQRDGYLRFGPAIYLSDAQLLNAIAALDEIINALETGALK